MMIENYTDQVILVCLAIAYLYILKLLIQGPSVKHLNKTSIFYKILKFVIGAFALWQLIRYRKDILLRCNRIAKIAVSRIDKQIDLIDPETKQKKK